ncbi:DASS family sodium-coupled anion symporter [Streptomyces aurantiogriseus]|uniref:Malate transporter YflS n=1 Tax=Streptomyces aurantiogriseus TaxID=66870 RepID=A0A918FLG7_9ACTN|nr:DASS family sodium-coupled anion symporter [Streptomyces aurantiogriseus]GGR51444.1 putative malate transporter YflS [Streptomyces aurantiogriseus]
MTPFRDTEGPLAGSAAGRTPARPRSTAVWTAAKWIAPVAVGLIVYLLPQPDGIKQGGWAVLAIFTATVLGLILQPLPLGAVALVGLTVTMITGTLEPDVALGGFSEPTIWLIVAAFFISLGFTKTGLGRRIALLFVRALGRSSLGLAYGITLTDLVLAPATPSNTARSGGVIHPVIRSLSTNAGSHPGDESRRKLGAYLSVTAMQVNTVTSAMFLTSMAANPLVQKLAADHGVHLTWTSWALAAIVPGLVALLVLPALLYRIFPPALRETPEAPGQARAQLTELGSMSRNEWTMAAVFVLLLLLWSVGGQVWDLSATVSAFTGVTLLLVSGVLTWGDLVAEKSAWTTLVWFSVLVMMAGQLQDLGVIGWFSDSITDAVSGVGWQAAFVALTLIYLFSHYLFASNTAHVAAMYAAFLAAATATGAPPVMAALVLGFISSLYGGLTHYASGPAPVLFGGGYVTLGEWWRTGLAAAAANIVIWMGVGAAWLKILGHW